MASLFFIQGRQQIVLQNLSLTGETSLKMMLVDSTYSPTASSSFVNEGGGASAASHEISVTGYTGGFNGSGRKTLTGKSFYRNDVSNRVEFRFTDITWSTVGGTTVIGGAVLIVEKTSDSDSWLVAFFDTNDITTNGSDIVLQVDATGALWF